MIGDTAVNSAPYLGLSNTAVKAAPSLGLSNWKP